MSTTLNSAKRRAFTPHFKFKVVKDAIASNDMTATARQYGVNPTLLSKWKRHADEYGHVIFERSPEKEYRVLRKKIEKLEQMIGQREVELSLLKNFSDFYASRSTT